MGTEKNVLIIGTGDQARVVAEILRASGRPFGGFVVPPGQQTKAPQGMQPLFEWNAARRMRETHECLVGIGDNVLRREVYEEASRAGFSFTLAVHPTAVVGKGVTIGAGSVVAAGAILVLEIRIGRGVIINTAASVDHHCRLGDWCHVGPGALLAGRVTLGAGAFVGAGAVVINGTSIGRHTVAGAGSVVVRDLPESVVAVGVPAAILHDGER